MFALVPGRGWLGYGRGLGVGEDAYCVCSPPFSVDIRLEVIVRSCGLSCVR